MTTWLRYVGASIMGILDPIPVPLTSPMSDAEGAWVRANAWTKALRRIDAAYPHGFHRWCSCERGTCHPCRSGHHDQCVSTNGPRVDDDAGTMTDRDGFVVAVIRYRSSERPCRWTCPLHPHPHRRRRRRRQRRGQAGQATEDCEAQPRRPAGCARYGGRAGSGRAALPLRQLLSCGGPGTRGDAVMPVQEPLPFENLAEMPTTSPWCQRWRAGKHSWRHVRDRGFDARRYDVDVIPDEEPGKAFVLAHHYSRSYPAVKVQFGLVRHRRRRPPAQRRRRVRSTW
ncbi:DUF6248 family natural product biosynthesis protein [Streptomyces thinghirensis]|nr:DUF6248 family natural product biosynthesis protein [Streptomyces thinghirensis]